jgi:hypothetical protein
MYHSPNLRIEQVSEDSELDLTEQHHASLPYSPPERQRRELPLPHYPSWDADWRSGGVSDDHAFITGPPPDRLYEDWLPDSSFELSPPETIKKPRRSDKERRGDGKGGVVDERTKQKRIKMLEQEFGAKPTDDPKYQRREKARQKREEKSQPGYVDRKLRITTQGRLKRAALRWIEALLALAAVLGSIGVLFVGPSRLFSVKLTRSKVDQTQRQASTTRRLAFLHSLRFCAHHFLMRPLALCLRTLLRPFLPSTTSQQFTRLGRHHPCPIRWFQWLCSSR